MCERECASSDKERTKNSVMIKRKSAIWWRTQIFYWHWIRHLFARGWYWKCAQQILFFLFFFWCFYYFHSASSSSSLSRLCLCARGNSSWRVFPSILLRWRKFAAKYCAMLHNNDTTTLMAMTMRILVIVNCFQPSIHRNKSITSTTNVLLDKNYTPWWCVWQGIKYASLDERRATQQASDRASVRERRERKFIVQVLMLFLYLQYKISEKQRKKKRWAYRRVVKQFAASAAAAAFFMFSNI